MTIELLHIDCMEYMSGCSDKSFDLAVVDPPYGLDSRLSNGAGKLRDRNFRQLYADKDWDRKPEPEYFIELFRVSINQII
jgi:site-specific DNA-methyltransferase (adenine-specific)